jgi:lipopolysaccharide/colanic/teichoic acid biosynthesis glycosyltransferase
MTDQLVAAYRDSRLRRVADLVLAVVGLVVLLPVLLLVALVVRLDSPGPALFRQVRVGRAGRPFEILKFRTMVVTAPGAGPQVSGRHDPRVTRVGDLLRRSRLDELPQLVNVLRGEMTIFGPRAEVPRYVEHYTGRERSLLQVRPGLLGAGQLFFAREQSAELDGAADPERVYLELQLHPKLALDLAYLDHRGLRRDARLAWATAVYLVGVQRTRPEDGAGGVPRINRKAPT